MRATRARPPRSTSSGIVGRPRPSRPPSVTTSRWWSGRSSARGSRRRPPVRDAKRAARPRRGSLGPRAGRPELIRVARGKVPGMCRSIKRLREGSEVVPDDEIRAAALQYVRKVSGFGAPTARHREAFDARSTAWPRPRRTSWTRSPRNSLGEPGAAVRPVARADAGDGGDGRRDAHRLDRRARRRAGRRTPRTRSRSRGCSRRRRRRPAARTSGRSSSRPSRPRATPSSTAVPATWPTSPAAGCTRRRSRSSSHWA